MKIPVLGIRRFLSRKFPKKARCFRKARRLTAGKHGLEIGGPSPIFQDRELLPIYPIVTMLDGCNFAKQTIWQGEIADGGSYEYGVNGKVGRQYVREATDLQGISPDTYDFVLSSHVIEHIANPIRALLEWRRVLRDNGGLILIVPHKDGTFDHNRPVTTLAHMQSDFDKSTSEDDLTHWLEIKKYHDLELDAEAGTIAEFEKRSLENQRNRCLHHHVFDSNLVAQLVNHADFILNYVEPILPFHIIAVCTKPSVGERVNNSRFLGDRAQYRRKSPFSSDCVVAGQ